MPNYINSIESAEEYHVTTKLRFHSVHEAYPILECTRVHVFYSIFLPLKFYFFSSPNGLSEMLCYFSLLRDGWTHRQKNDVDK